ncbi:TNF receptor-associated factor 2-like isoform X2 [Ptychodera flava]|uniref:TNF receptor-associated factor 2-like isoform X2 n=1 Tax=Ptychodera flava TaxID=63121 RepID=UPI00396A4E66
MESCLLSLNKVYSDKAILRELNELSVQCPNDSCPWIGDYKQYDQDHHRTCPLEQISCIKAGCEMIVRRIQLTEHLENDCKFRVVKCQYCRVEFTQKELEMKDQRNAERDVCGKKVVACKFKDVGCNVQVEQGHGSEYSRRFIGPGEHLFMLLQTVIRVSSIVQNMKGYDKLDEAKRQSELQGKSLQSLTSEVRKIETQLQQIINDASVSDKSHLSTTAAERLDGLYSRTSDMRNRLTIMQTKVSTFEDIAAVISNQIEGDTGKYETLQRHRKVDREIIESLERKVKAQDRIVALKDVALAEQDLRIQSLEMASYNGELICKISDFKRKRQDAISGKNLSIYSPFFHTSRHGYKMCARIYLNGDGMGKGNHVSVFFTIMKGAFDALLQWPFRQKVTLMWIDQNDKEHVIDAFRPDPTSSSFRRPTQDMNIASGCPLFMPLSQLGSLRNAYVKDDVAFLKVIVDKCDLI